MISKEELFEALVGLRFRPEYAKPENHVMVGALVIVKIYDPEEDEIYCWDVSSLELNFLERVGMLRSVLATELDGQATRVCEREDDEE